MSETPETDALLDRVDAAMKLIEITRRERDEAIQQLTERDEEWFQIIESFAGFHPVSITDALKQGIKRSKKQKEERDEAQIQYRSTLALAEALANTQIELKKERDEALAQMCQAVGYLSTIAEDCDAWLNNQCDETACEFIKAVRDYAKKAINNDEHL
jgi:hypothetical protein